MMNYFHRSSSIILAFLGIVVFSHTAYGDLTARLERDTININQTVNLIIEMDQVANGDQPDLSVLNRSFNVLGTSSSQNVSITNGKQTSVTRWVIQLEPLGVGSFTIPPITVGNQKTRAQRITVLPQESLAKGDPGDIFVEMETDSDESYVQQQITLVIRLFLGVKILDGTLSEPESENTDVQRIGNDVQYQTTVGNRQYRVIERKYALFPEHSGQLDIPPIRFQGVAEDESSASNQIFNGLFNQGTRIRAKSESVSVNIQPPDTNFSGSTWLPAKSLAITETASEFEQVEVGQPVTRQIQIQATGLTAEQLPDIKFSDTPDLKQYPDKTIRQTQQDGKDVIGLVNRSIAVIATKEGDITLPGTSLKWWNTETNQMETAVLPEKTVRVIADPATTTILDPTPVTDTVPVSSTGNQRSDQHLDENNNSFWMWLSLVCIAGWILTTLYLYKRTRNIRKVDPGSQENCEIELNSKKLVARIKQTCKDGDARGTRALLTAWAKNYWPEFPPMTLDEIATRLNSKELALELNHLDQYLYAEPNQATELQNQRSPGWSGTNLMRLFSALPGSSSGIHSKSRQILPQLYPLNAGSGIE